jgi:YD repeat-containing protein
VRLGAAGRRGSAFDANGNTLSDSQGRGFTWDFENRLTQAVVPGTGTVTFRYDPFGRRIQKSGPLGTTNYLYDGYNDIEEVDNAGNELAKYTHGAAIDEDLATLRNGTASYYHQDGLGSITSLSSSTGALANTYTYDAFGRLTASTGNLTNPFQYTGREFDSETGLLFNRARYFDPSADDSSVKTRSVSEADRTSMRTFGIILQSLRMYSGIRGVTRRSGRSRPVLAADLPIRTRRTRDPTAFWHNVPEWYPDMVGTMLPEPPPNDDDVLEPGNCECKLQNLVETENELRDQANEWDEHTVMFGGFKALGLKVSRLIRWDEKVDPRSRMALSYRNQRTLGAITADKEIDLEQA